MAQIAPPAEEFDAGKYEFVQGVNESGYEYQFSVPIGSSTSAAAAMSSATGTILDNLGFEEKVNWKADDVWHGLREDVAQRTGIVAYRLSRMLPDEYMYLLRAIYNKEQEYFFFAEGGRMCQMNVTDTYDMKFTHFLSRTDSIVKVIGAGSRDWK